MNKKTINLCALVLAVTMAFSGCKKDVFSDPADGPVNSSGNYSSLQDFYTQNQPAMWQFNINAVTGGSFTSQQGTFVTIPPNAFVDQSGNPVTGNVVVKFQDLYKKSDMLFTGMDTKTTWGTPLKSGGEFFIKAEQNSMGLTLATGKKITVAQPAALTGGLDTGMTAFTAMPDTNNQGNDWAPTPFDSLAYGVVNNVNSYVYSLYTSNPNGVWSNSDNSYPFSSVPQTNLNMHSSNSLQPYGYNVDCWLIFTNENATIHVYTYGDDAPYYNAPLGYQCTAVNIATKDGKLFAAFTPVTIGNNMTVNYTLTEMTTAAFKAQLDALN